ncbi:MAG: malto-oligosyltrehalose synthase, partial [Candidatus Competibacterales bacterium]|nr:malto-oligosyltrehalose synthase [Candidatus Competibacterales bacterium]
RRHQVQTQRQRLAALAAGSEAVAGAIAAQLDVLNGTPGEAQRFDALHRLLERQHYRLAFWRVAAHEINYRRFFDVNELAGLAMERPELFRDSHRLIARLIRENRIQGLRLDHVDGLRDPRAYLTQLQRLAPGGDLYLLVEKILAPHESLRRDWPVAGTTGYEFLNLVNGLFVDPEGEPGMTRCYQRFAGASTDFPALVISAKQQVIREALASELQVLANRFNRLAKQNRHTRDYSLLALREALIGVVAHFPVYRTYVTARHTTPEDHRDLDWAVARARKAARTPDRSIYDFIRAVLSLDLLREDGYRRRDLVDAALRFQQFTGPVMAKALEDTAFYRYVRLSSLNEVGGEPEHFGRSPAAFHEANRRRLQHWPQAMLTSATHDHKRGEDLRARLDVLSELPQEWRQRIRRWARFNQRKKRDIDGISAPDRNDEYLYYQTLIGAWPYTLAAPDFAGLDGFRQRLVDYALKAAREAKRHTSWVARDEDYEAALTQFIERTLNLELSRPFLEDVAAFVTRVAPAGAVNGLAQTLLRLTSPGVPDLYQGNEYWDFSLVDPDNRRPVDYARRAATLDDADLPTLLADWRDGRLKQHLIRTTLTLRRVQSELFTQGGYQPLTDEGDHSERVVAFARTLGEAACVVVVPRLVQPLLDSSDSLLPRDWGDTR